MKIVMGLELRERKAEKKRRMAKAKEENLFFSR